MISCTYQANLFADKPCVAESNQPTRSMAVLQRAARMVSGSIAQLNLAARTADKLHCKPLLMHRT